jgi:hypothetical protein
MSGQSSTVLLGKIKQVYGRKNPHKPLSWHCGRSEVAGVGLEPTTQGL